MATLLELAEFSDAVYGHGDAPALGEGGVWKLLNIQPSAAAIAAGYYAEAWQNTATGEIVIANRGTDIPGGHYNNLGSDAQLAAGDPTTVAQYAAEFALSVENMNTTGAPITETGHSLGGYEAQVGLAALVDSGVTAAGVTFDGPGIPDFYHRQALSSYNCLNLYAQGDIIHMAGGSHLGVTALLPVGPTPTDELNAYESAFKIANAAGVPLATEIATAALSSVALGAHALGTLSDPTTPLGYLYANQTGVGGWTAQQFIQSGQGQTPSTVVMPEGDGISFVYSVPGTQAVVTFATQGVVSLIQAADSGLLGTLALSAFNAETGGAANLAYAYLSSLNSFFSSSGDVVATFGNNGVSFSSSATATTGLLGEAQIPGAKPGQYIYNVPQQSGSFSELIEAGATGAPQTIWLGGNNYTQLTGGAPVAGSPDTWYDSNTQLTYTFTADPGSAIGDLQIKGSGLGANGNNSITVGNFNLSAAESNAAGFMGIKLTGSLNLTAHATLGTPEPGVFTGGSEQSFTLSVDAPASFAQTILVALSGVNASDFTTLGQGVSVMGSNGTFAVTLPAGKTSVTFGLIDTTAQNGQSIVAGTTLQLVASMPNVVQPNGALIQSSTLTLPYVAGAVDTSTAPQTTSVITGTLSGGVTTYQGDGGDDFISAGPGPNLISAANSANDSIIGGSGSNTIYGGAGNDVIVLHGTQDLVSLGNGFNTLTGASGQDTIYGHGGSDIISGNGGTDLIFARNGHNELYAGAQTNLATAIQQAGSGSGTGLQGDLMTVLDGDNTIVGGSGNDLVTAGSGHDVIVLGPGNDTFEGGISVTDGAANWNTSITHPAGSGSYHLQINNVVGTVEPFTNPYAQPYNGVVDTDNNALNGVANDTIYAGNGNDFIYLGNGNNFVEVGSGIDSIFGGMGNDTIIAGTGADLIRGGGGETYIQGGSGADTIYGGDGDNTIIGGSGNSTITSAQGPTTTWANENLENNYVTGGSGNDVIYGSGGNDTLIGGSGNSTIYGGTGNENIVGGSGNDSLIGGSGNDTLEAGGAGNDSLFANGSSTSKTLMKGGNGADLIEGGSGQNTIYAGDGGNLSAPTSVIASPDSTSATTIYGGSGIDFLQGGAGTNVIYGGDGGTSTAPTTILAASGSTTVYGGLGTEYIQGGSGTDVLYAGDGGTQSAPTTIYAGTGTASLYGGGSQGVLEDLQSGTDLLVGGTNNDSIVGIGIDTLQAGSGSDLLQANGGSVTFDVNAGGGQDSIYALNGALENIVLGTGIAPTSLFGSISFDAAGNSYLDLNSSSLSLDVEGALTGSLGSITFADSGPISVPTLLSDVFGGDTVAGLGNNDLIVGLQGNETLKAGTYFDTISSWGSGAVITGGSAYRGDVIYSAGNAASIKSGTGADVINAVGNYDTIKGGTYGDHITISGANSIATSGSGADSLTASGTNDTLVGGSGHTTFFVNSASTTVQTGTADTIVSSVNFSLASSPNANYLVLSGTANIAGTTNSNLDTLVGGSGQDTLTATSAATPETLIGGSGNTTFVVNATGDAVSNTYTNANDTVQSSVNYTLPTNINSLTLTGTAALTGTANAGNDTLVSNTGADTLYAGTGSDMFVISSTSVVIQGSTTANSSISSSVSYTLPSLVNGLILTGTANLSATANSANDTLVSNSGIDTLVGGTGADVFVVNNASDVLTNLNATDTIESSVAFTLPSGAATLVLTGTSSLSATGNSGNNSITANSGNDTLAAGAGIATLIGGAGATTFKVNNSSDVVQQSVAGTGSVIQATATFALPTNVNVLSLTGTGNISATGNSANDSLIGGSGLDTLYAGAGTDTLVAGSGSNTLVAGAGLDTFVVNSVSDVIQAATSTNDTVQSSASYTLPANVNALMLTGTAALTATTNSGNDLVVGNSGADTLTATGGLDTLVAGAGLATFVGGTGADTFIVNNSGDVVSVGASHGSDTIQSSANYVLPSNVTSLLLTGTAALKGTGYATGADVITGNGGADTLVAGGGLDTLTAGGGLATLVGGSAGSVFVINNAADVIQSVAGGVSNTLVSSVSTTLMANIDTLQLSGNANLQGIGNNDSNNTLIANSGNDTLVSGTGVTLLEGGVGSDTFIVNNAADTVQAQAAGTNTVIAAVSYAAPANVSTLILSGTASLTATGNTLSDSIVGNAGQDTLYAGVGDDTLVAGSGLATLVGNKGNDTFVINNAADVIQSAVAGENNALISSVSVTLPTNINTLTLSGSGAIAGTANAGNDLLTGNAGADTLIAGAGSDTLVAGAGVATLKGGAGNTTFVVNNTADVIQGASSTSSNALISSVSYTLPTNVNSLTLKGGANIAGTANAANDSLVGGDGTDTLYAGAGADTLVGGSGNTTFVVNSSSDVVQDAYSGSTNTINASANYVLPTNVNTLVITGTGALKGTANAGNDSLVSNAGVDTLIGGAGSDTFVVNNSNDVIQDSASSASNSVQASVTYVLPTNVNLLTLTGTSALKGTANSGNDTLTSNNAVDTLVGGTGNDVFVVNNAADLIQDTSSTASNTVVSSASFVLPVNVNTLTLTGSAALSGTGNTAANVITANSGNDTLIAGTGVATLIGGSGSDLFVVNSTADTVQGVVGSNSTISASVNFTLPANVGTLVLTGTANLKATSGGGNDTLISNSGVDTLVGGSGADVFVVNNAADVLQNVGAGDTIESSVGFTMPIGASALTLIGSSNILASAGTTSGTLTGSAGADTLVAGSGLTTMVAGSGNTTFVVNNSADVIQDTVLGSNSTIQSSVSYNLPTNVDTIWLTGSGAATVSGNQDNENVLSGNAGNDLINGTATFTTINGGSGIDTLNAGPYFNVINAGSGGTVGAPTVVQGNSSLASIYTESTIYGGTGSGTDNLWGGPGSDVIYAGNGLDTSVHGGSGHDTIYGGAGNGQWLYATALGDVVYAGAGGTSAAPTTIYTNVTGGGANSIHGGSGYALAGDQNPSTGGTSVFYGGTGFLGVTGAGADTLIAGSGSSEMSDGFQAGVKGTPTLLLNTGYGTAAIIASGSGAYSNLSFGTGLAPASLGITAAIDPYSGGVALAITSGTGTAYVDNGLNAGVPSTPYQAANPSGIGSINFADSGAATLAQLVAQGHTTDATVTTSGGQFTFSATASASITGSSSVADTISAWGAGDTLTAGTTTTSIAAEGANSAIYAGSGSDTLEAFGNADSLYGASIASSTLFVVGNTTDVVSQSVANGGVDTLVSSVSFTLPTNVDVLELGGSAAVVGTGNADAAVRIYGNSGSDTLVAGSGATTLVAGAGNQLLQGGAGNDSLDASAGGNDTLSAGTGLATLHGGAGANVFVINNASDVISSTKSLYGNDTIESAVTESNTSNYIHTLIGTGSASIRLYLGSGADSIVANSGGDTLQAAGANDTLVGGTGGDLFVVTDPSTVLVNGSSNDTVLAGGAYTLGAGITTLFTGSGSMGTGNNLNDTIVDTSGTGNATLVAGSGLDTLKAGTGNTQTDYLISSATALTTMDGGSSPVVFVVNNTSDVLLNTITTDTIESGLSFALPSTVNNLILTGTGNVTGTANANSDVLTANSANDTLISGTAKDTLIGGTLATSNDLFVVNNATDVITVGSTHGSDTIQSSVSFTASANVANLQLTGTAALSGTGNAIADVITANSGADTLTAGSGIATLAGGSGNDTFVVNSASDVVQNTFTASNDTIKSSVTYTLPTNVNSLVLTGTSALKGTANSANVTLTSNTGVDTLVGGVGNDTFVIGNSSDVIQDTSSTANNVAQASVTYVLPTNVNTLILTGTFALKGTANSGNDTLTSNTGVDTLVAGTSASSNDLLIVNNASDVLTIGATHGTDTIQSSVTYTLPTTVNILTLSGTGAVKGTANTGNDTLISNTGVDTLVGGTLASSNDLFVVNNASDVITVGSTHGVDTIQSSVSFTASANVGNLQLTGTAALSATGNSIADAISANSGADTLTAGSGVATLVGGSGNDMFVVNSTSDVVQNTFTAANDTIKSSVSYTLPANVNSLVLTGSAALTGTANGGSDTLTSNSAIDTLVGGSGNDTFVIGNSSDVIQDTSTTTNNAVQASVTYVLPNNVNTLTLTGTAALKGTANSGNDTLVSNTGVDTLVAGTTASSNDVLVVNNASDVVTVGATHGNDTVQSSVSYVLPTNVQYLSLGGTAGLTGTGNSLTDLIVGNSGNDTLSGGTGIAVLEGGKTGGQDLLQAASNQAALIGGAGSSTLTGGAFKDFYAAGLVSDTITTGATSNVVAVNKGDGAETLAPTSGATNVLSLGGGIDTENLTFTKSGNNLILNDGVAGDSITFTNWYLGSADQNYTTLQVVEIASSQYNSSGSDGLRNKPLEEFNFASLVSQFNTAGSPANWSLSNGMPSAQLASSATAAYGGDLAYYFGLNGNLTGMNLASAQSTLTNASFGTATQTIDSWSGISGGPIVLLARPPLVSLGSQTASNSILVHSGRTLRPTEVVNPQGGDPSTAPIASPEVYADRPHVSGEEYYALADMSGAKTRLVAQAEADEPRSYPLPAAISPSALQSVLRNFGSIETTAMTSENVPARLTGALVTREALSALVGGTSEARRGETAHSWAAMHAILESTVENGIGILAGDIEPERDPVLGSGSFTVGLSGDSTLKHWHTEGTLPKGRLTGD